MENGSRTGVVEHVRLKDFDKTKQDEDGNFVVMVPDHKTPT